VNEKPFKSHRSVLAEVSPFFREQGYSNSKEISVTGAIDDDTFRIFLKFIY